MDGQDQDGRVRAGGTRGRSNGATAGGRAAALVGLGAALVFLAGCRGDGVHLGDRGLFYSPGSLAGRTCRYAPISSGVDLAVAVRGDAEAAMSHSKAAMTALPRTGGRYLEVDGPGFVSLGCDNWVAADSIRDVVPGDGVPAGMFRVGHDLEPGLYESSGGPTCTWEVRGSARGDARLLATGEGRSGMLVELERDDTYLLSTGCGPFHLVAPR